MISERTYRGYDGGYDLYPKSTRSARNTGSSGESDSDMFIALIALSLTAGLLGAGLLTVIKLVS